MDGDKVNVNGGACALGHPIGATGAMLIGAVLDELVGRDLKRGLVTTCAAGGMAPATSSNGSDNPLGIDHPPLDAARGPD